MALSRRHLLVVAASVPAFLAARQAGELLAEAVLAAARGARPSPDGTSASRCAQCGSPDHDMFHPGCPLAPRVLA